MSPSKISDTKDLGRGKRLAEERKKIWKSRDKFRKDTKLSDGSLRNWENGLNISCECLREIHERGGDIVYILTGKRSFGVSAVNNSNSNVLTNNEAINGSISQLAGAGLRATGTDGVHQVLLEQIAELKKDKEELRADKALLMKQLEDALNTAEELKALYKELAQVKSAASAATTRTRAPKSTNKKA